MKLIKELLTEALKFRLHDIIKTPKGSGKVVRVFRNKVQVAFDKGPDAVFDLGDLKPLNEAVSPLKKMAKALKFPAGTSYHEGSQNWPDSAEWRKRGGYAGQKSQSKTMDAMKGLGFVKADANSSHNGDGSHFHDDWTYETDEWTLTFHEHTGSVKSENSYSMKLTKKKSVKEAMVYTDFAPSNDNFLKLPISTQRKMYKAADLGHVVLNRKWKPGELLAHMEKAKASKK